MKHYDWDIRKNEKLVKERNISFEEVVFLIEKGYLLDIVEHPNETKYKNQKIYIVDINDYIFLVPFIENDDEIFLKTIIPSRKATQKYLPKRGE